MGFPLFFRMSLMLIATTALLAAANPRSTSPSVLSPAPVEKETPSVAYKNLARFHVGTLMERFDPGTRLYIPEGSAASLLDEDDASFFEFPQGKHWLLLILENPALIQNFSLASENIKGKISLYASEQKAPPHAKSWEPLFKGIEAERLNEKEYPKPLYRFGRYFLVEIDLESSAKISSLYLYTDSDASTYRLSKRPKPFRFSDKLGPYPINSKSQINFSGRYARPPSGSDDPNLAAMTDESPGTSASLGQKPMRIDLKEGRSLEKITLLTEKKKGSMKFSLEDDLVAAIGTQLNHFSAEIQQMLMVGWGREGAFLVQAEGGTIPKPTNALTRSIEVDGSNACITIDLPPTSTRFVTLNWSSADPSSPDLSVKNFSTMGEVSLGDFQVTRGVPSETRVSEELPGSSQNQESSNSNIDGVTSGRVGKTSLENQSLKTNEQLLNESLNLPVITPVSN